MTFQFGVDFARLRADLLDQIRRLDRAPEAMTTAHQRSVDWLGQRAAANLRANRRRARDFRNTPGLEAILTNPEVSKVTSHGFVYLIPERLAALSARTAKYYRVIEGAPGGGPIGSTWWVEHFQERGLRLYFYGGGGGAGGGQAALGSRTAGYPFIAVRSMKPIPAYHYLAQTQNAFIKGNLYYKWAYEELRRVGIPVVTRYRPGG